MPIENGSIENNDNDDGFVMSLFKYVQSILSTGTVRKFNPIFTGYLLFMNLIGFNKAGNSRFYLNVNKIHSFRLFEPINGNPFRYILQYFSSSLSSLPFEYETHQAP